MSIAPNKNEIPSDYSERLGIVYSNETTIEEKKAVGQFFTPLVIARFMATLISHKSSSVKILDPGIGTGILSISLIERLVENNNNLNLIHLTAYELDANLIQHTILCLDYLKNWLQNKEIDFEYLLLQEDFIISNGEVIKNENTLLQQESIKFDIIISNPPYFKLNKLDKRVKLTENIIKGQANIYSLFMAIASNLLADNGEIIFITPRSYTSGFYFKSFRDYFFSKVKIDKIHLFHSRKETFSKDKVLQETIILKGSKLTNKFSDVTITSSTSQIDINNLFKVTIPYNFAIDLKSTDKILFTPTKEKEVEIMKLFKSWTNKMEDFNIQISTGPVVSFRSRDYLKDEEVKSCIPLIWLNHVKKMKLDFPLDAFEKPQFIQDLDETQTILLPNKNYILLRRFSSKDDKSRLVAAPYIGTIYKYKNIGIENKVNYIYRPKGHLTRVEIMGLSAILNSELFDNYFRIFNGNVNVSASELRLMPLPPKDKIIEIGKKVILENSFDIQSINLLVTNILKKQPILV